MSSQVPDAAPSADRTPSPDSAPAASGTLRPGPARAVLLVYTAAVFASAFLLFLVQPMFSKMVLPLLGGTPAVWNTCMLFFQAALLGGYLYAHLGTRLSSKHQALLHIALLALAGLMLPISVAGAAPEGGEAPIPWLLVTMAGTVGLPFFVLSGTGPMLQRWFANTGHPGAANPYWLYAASNLGSMLGLLGYPFFVEPRWRLAGQSAYWMLGYLVLVALIVGCALALRGATGPAAAVDAAGEAVRDEPVTRRERLVWTALAFVPSSLLLSVTTFITTDLAPVPLLWVLPLALYLLTFTLAFAGRPPIPHRWMVAAQPALLGGVALLLMHGFTRRPEYVIPLHLGMLFVTGMVCHGELARRRPAVRHLTEFYLWISLGGVLGGIFNVLVAPVLFSRLWEYPLVLAAAALARPWPSREKRAGGRASWWGAVRAAGFVAVLLLVSDTNLAGLPALAVLLIPMAAAVLLAVALGRTPVWLAACLAAALAIQTAGSLRDRTTLLAERSFFGRFTVVLNPGQGGVHALYHGSTLHGAQKRAPAERREPITYYVEEGPFGQLFQAARTRPGPKRVAVVGLGTGTAAAYARRGDRWTYYEIDPHVERVARDPRYFTYLRDSPAPVRVVLGDARLSLAAAPDAAYDLIILDAFSSDAIPMHLITREALGMYLRKLAPGGMIVYHISNRYLDLEPVVATLAWERDLAALVGEGKGIGGWFRSSSTWVAVARSGQDFGPLDADARWRPARLERGMRPWTDDYSSILSVWGRAK